MKWFNLLKIFKIRADRLRWLQNGFVIASFIATFVAAYWHSQDRLAVRPTIRMAKKSLSRETEIKKIRETPIAGSRKGADKYYKMEEETALPTIPDLPEEPDEK